MFLRFIFSLAGVLYVWFGSPRSTIGYPSFYWEQGILSLLGFIILLIPIVLTVFISVVFIYEDRTGRNLEVDLPCFPCLSIIGIIIIQILPVPPYGLQLFPYSDASYIRPIATNIWLACWFLLIAVAITYWAGNIKFVSVAVLLLISSVLLLNSFTKNDQPSASTQAMSARSSAPLKFVPTTQEQDVKALLVISKRKREKMSETLKQLQSQHREAVPTFGATKKNSQTSSRERMEMQLNAERQELALQISQVESDLERLDETILSMESAIRRKERQRLVSDQGVLDDAEYEKLLQKLLLLDADLSEAR